MLGTDTETLQGVINARDLQQVLNDTVVLDCRFALSDKTAGLTAYQDGHIPGAYYCDLEDHLSSPLEKHGGRHPLPKAETLISQLSRWGIHSEKPVVVYDDQRLAFAARAWWILKMAGVQKVAVLNGGYSAWLSNGYFIDRRTSSETCNTSAENTGLHADWQCVSKDCSMVQSGSANGSITLIDSREPSRYRGEQEPIDPIAGHIPSAINLPWTEVTDENGYVQPVEFHRQRWQFLNTTAAEPVVYCGSGVTACVNIFSAHLAGHQLTLYPGSWSDWCSYADLPVATSS